MSTSNIDNNSGSSGADLDDLVHFVRRFWVLIVLLILAGSIASAAANVSHKHSYAAVVRFQLPGDWEVVSPLTNNVLQAIYDEKEANIANGAVTISYSAGSPDEARKPVVDALHRILAAVPSPDVATTDDEIVDAVLLDRWALKVKARSVAVSIPDSPVSAATSGAFAGLIAAFFIGICIEFVRRLRRGSGEQITDQS